VTDKAGVGVNAWYPAAGGLVIKWLLTN